MVVGGTQARPTTGAGLGFLPLLCDAIHAAAVWMHTYGSVLIIGMPVRAAPWVTYDIITTRRTTPPVPLLLLRQLPRQQQCQEAQQRKEAIGSYCRKLRYRASFFANIHKTQSLFRTSQR